MTKPAVRNFLFLPLSYSYFYAQNLDLKFEHITVDYGLSNTISVLSYKVTRASFGLASVKALIGMTVIASNRIEKIEMNLILFQTISFGLRVWSKSKSGSFVQTRKMLFIR